MNSIIIIILILVVVYLIYKCAHSKIIESEHFDNYVTMYQQEPEEEPIPKQMRHQIQGEYMFPSNQYVKNDRYVMQDMKSGVLSSPFNNMTKSPESCASDQWDVYYEPGANGTVGDSVWNSSSPKMVLQDNCIRCKEFSGMVMHNYPSGAQEKEVDELQDGIPDKVKIDSHGMLHSSDMLSEEVGCGEPTNLKYNASYRMGTGIVMPPKDCLSRKIHDGMIN